MIWIVAIILAALAYYLVSQRHINPAVCVIVAVVVLFFGMLALLYWLVNFHDVNAYVVNSWQFLAGVHSPGQIVVHSNSCAQQNFWVSVGKLILYFLLVAVVIFGDILSLIAIIGIPVGLLLAIIGAIVALVSKGEDSVLLKRGLGLLFLGLVVIVVSAFVFHIIHWATFHLGQCS